MTRMRDVHANDGERNVLEFDFGVRAYAPVQPGGYWRIRWEECRQPKDTSAKDQAAQCTSPTSRRDPRHAREVAEGVLCGELLRRGQAHPDRVTRGDLPLDVRHDRPEPIIRVPARQGRP
jgi:hypothetical protein